MPFCTVEKFLEETIGLEIGSIGKSFFERTTASLMEQSGIKDMESYSELLRNSSEDLERLVEKVVVPETWFFRDVEPFIFLQQYVERDWIPSHRGKILRVLSVPCSTGEEPYSIAMTFLQAGLWPDQFYIDAVDISKKGLEYAKKAIYGKSALRGKGVNYQNRYFQKTERGYKLDAQITSLVHFHHDNLLHPTFLAEHTPYHIIFCRNLLIYLTREARMKILDNLNSIITSNGLLFTGHSELPFFFQYGYTRINHSRSFACKKKYEHRDREPVVTKKEHKEVYKIVQANHTDQKILHPHHKVFERTETPLKQTSESTLATVRALANQGALEKAFSICKTYIQEHNTNPEGYYLFGLINNALDCFSAAEEYFLKSIYLDPHYYEALVQLSLLYEQTGRTTKSSLFKERAKRIHRTGKNTIKRR